MRPNIKILVLGGTITMTTSGKNGASPSLTGLDLANSLPQLNEIVNIDVETLMLKPSASLTWEDIRICHDKITSATQNGADGIVILQGTDTIEECAFIFDLVFDIPQPIIVSGAMRATNTPGFDGPANLLAAVSLAAHPSARGFGTMVVMNDVIHAARFVVKEHTAFTNAFNSRLAGPMGMVHEGKPCLLYKPIHKLPKFTLPSTPAPDVGLFSLAFSQRWPFQAMQEYDALILELAGSGHVSEHDVAAMKDLSKKIPVVFTSRASHGFIMHSTYNYPGSEQELISAGFIPAGQYDGLKARLITMLALWNNKKIDAALFNN